jgi:deazaflavin-dependent oxidoreductase (nitroreductase family)
VLTSQGAKSGKIRKIPLMRIEHNGVYAVVASHAGAPKNPFWYYNLVANPLVELQDGAVKQDMRARKRTSGGSGPTPRIQNSPITGPVQAAKFRCSL